MGWRVSGEREAKALLTGAVGGDARSPGREGLVVIQLISRRAQQNQEEKSAPPRHRHLNTRDTTNPKDAGNQSIIMDRDVWRWTEKQRRRKLKSFGSKAICDQKRFASSQPSDVRDSSDRCGLAWVYKEAADYGSACGPIRTQRAATWPRSFHY